MDQSILNAIARIRILVGGAEVNRGSGFLVNTSGLVLTALHVVADRRQSPPQFYQGTIQLGFPGHTTEAVVLDAWDAYADWALLRCTTPPPSVDPLPLRPDSTVTGTAWESFGFPESKPDGLSVQGDVTNPDGGVEGTRALQLFTREAAAGNGMPVKGLSGAPVLVGRSAVGLLRWAMMREQNAVGGTLFACPMRMILDRCVNLLTSETRAAAKPSLAPVPAPAAAGFRELKHHVLLAYSELDEEHMRACTEQLRQHNYSVLSLPQALFAENDRDFLELERGLRQSHTTMLMFSQASLQQWRDRSAQTARVLSILRARTGCLIPLWHGEGAPQCPPDWNLTDIISVSPEEVRNWSTGPIQRVQERLHACVPQPHALTVGLPFVIVAMKAEEAEALERQPERLRDEMGRTIYDQYTNLQTALGEGSPLSRRYGPRREDWQPFSDSDRTVWQVIEDIVGDLNRGPNPRLRKRSIKIQYYPFEIDAESLRNLDSVYRELARTGCIVLADELSMFHWNLRQTFFQSPFYNSEQASLVTLSPVNPCSLASDRILESELREKLAIAFSRFARNYDPQCEFGIGDERRLRRWLHSSLPQAVDNLWTPPPNRQALGSFASEVEQG